MKRRLLVAVSIAAVSAFVALQSLPLQGQGQNQSTIGAGTPDLVITAYNDGPPIAYTVPRTPWGDPTCRAPGRVTTRSSAVAGGAEDEAAVAELQAPQRLRRRAVPHAAVPRQMRRRERRDAERRPRAHRHRST